jgi:hypothetical protein
MVSKNPDGRPEFNLTDLRRRKLVEGDKLTPAALQVVKAAFDIYLLNGNTIRFRTRPWLSKCATVSEETKASVPLMNPPTRDGRDQR